MTLGQQTAGRDLKVRYLYLGIFMMFLLLVLAVRLYRLQVTRGEEFSAKSVENFVKEVRIPADRGLILDTNGRILVDSRPSFDVFITPAFCVKCKDEVLPRLGEALGWDEAQREEAERLVTKGRREAPFRPTVVKIDIPRELADLLDARRLELPGVDIQATPHRNYRSGEVLSHVIGYMNEITQQEIERLNAAGARYQLGDYVGRNGLEKAFESYLRGQDGNRKRVVDARGRPIPGLSDLVGGGDIVEPVAGNNIVLSIDMRLQEEADRVFPGKAGAVLVVDVRTGFILTMLSKPGFDPNLLTGRITGSQLAEMSRDPFKPMMNRCTAMHYSPASTFKVVTSLAALRARAYTPETVVNCPGGYRLGRRVWKCWREAGHGPMDGTHALKHSCNTYFFRAADMLGIDPIAREGRELGLGRPTGLDVLPEEKGIMPDEAYHDRVTPGGYTKGMALNTSIGQGDVNVTPLQLAMAYATIANGGQLLKPQLVRRIETTDGELRKRFERELVRDVDMRPEDRAVVVEALKAVVNTPGGTAYARRLKDVLVAGKTGTAQVARLRARGLKKDQIDYWLRDHAWFAAFAPADDPEVAIVVLNEHGGGGSSDAAPAAMAVLQKYFDLQKEDRGIPPSAAADAREGAPLLLPPPPVATAQPMPRPLPPPAAVQPAPRPSPPAAAVQPAPRPSPPAAAVQPVPRPSPPAAAVQPVPRPSPPPAPVQPVIAAPPAGSEPASEAQLPREPSTPPRASPTADTVAPPQDATVAPTPPLPPELAPLPPGEPADPEPMDDP